MHSTITQPAGQPPIQEMFMMREYTPAELLGLAAKFRQKARESIQAWLLQSWDTLDMATIYVL